jgi:hypothetical protein
LFDARPEWGRGQAARTGQPRSPTDSRPAGHPAGVQVARPLEARLQRRGHTCELSPSLSSIAMTTPTASSFGTQHERLSVRRAVFGSPNLHRPCRARSAGPVPGREDWRRARPDGTGPWSVLVLWRTRDHRARAGHRRLPRAKKNRRSIGLWLQQRAQRQRRNKIVVLEVTGSGALRH